MIIGTCLLKLHMYSLVIKLQDRKVEGFKFDPKAHKTFRGWYALEINVNDLRKYEIMKIKFMVNIIYFLGILTAKIRLAFNRFKRLNKKLI